MYYNKNFCAESGFMEINVDFTAGAHAVRISFCILE